MASTGLFRATCCRCTTFNVPQASTRLVMARQLSVSQSCRTSDRKKTGEEGPIRFTGSKAESWSMANVKMAPKTDVPSYQAVSVTLSLGVFLIYFLYMREENDLDIELNYTLFERVPGMEEHQIKVAMDYNRMYGKDTTDLESRLAEIQASKLKKSTQ